VALEHVCVRQLVDAPGYVQAVAVPPHMPPHAVPSVAHAARDPCGAPDVSVVHVPTWPVASHAWHCPEQAVVQHTPSTHSFVVHWLPDVQADPVTFRPHDPEVQTLPLEQPVLVPVQVW
jgi:hypothetical protein